MIISQDVRFIKIANNYLKVFLQTIYLINIMGALAKNGVYGKLYRIIYKIIATTEIQINPLAAVGRLISPAHSQMSLDK